MMRIFHSTPRSFVRGFAGKSYGQRPWAIVITFAKETGEPPRAIRRPDPMGLFTTFVAFGGAKLSINNGELRGFSVKNGKEVTARLLRDGKPISHAELGALAVKFVARAKKQKADANKRIERLDRDLKSMK